MGEEAQWKEVQHAMDNLAQSLERVVPIDNQGKMKLHKSIRNPNSQEIVSITVSIWKKTVLPNNREIAGKQKMKRSKENKKNKKAKKQANEACASCHKSGHIKENYWRRLGACLKCGSLEHRISECPPLSTDEELAVDRNPWPEPETSTVCGCRQASGLLSTDAHRAGSNDWRSLLAFCIDWRIHQASRNHPRLQELKHIEDSSLLRRTGEAGVPVLEEDIARSDIEREE
ncbi:hypothetical protein Taro_000979 [Colocasia esculenta]|uniref:CCHC-type domain-containing protein n=1 Tax=Colocasia esculenta TaxID=4460 RepID=A0A843TEN5_COLES|nr:hypothetical protein [Colocasia esculenta]